MTTTPKNEAGLRAARRFAGWELGDAYWAERIISIYLDPERYNKLADEAYIPKTTGVRGRW